MVLAGLRWTAATLARWGLGAGLLVSFTAAAGVDATTGYSARGPSRFVEARAFAPERPEAGVMLLDSFSVGALDPSDPAISGALGPQDTRPRHETKNGLAAPVLLDRAAKGDGGPGLGARREARLRDEIRLILFSPGLSDREPSALLHPDAADATGLPSRFVAPGGHLENTASPSVETPSASPARIDPRHLNGDGATPSVSRAVGLSTTTPTARGEDLRRVLAAVTPGARNKAGRWSTGIFPLSTEAVRFGFATLVDPGKMDAEQHCLAQAIYFEARSEPLAGQAAVAQVIFNRIKSGMYPTTVCGVVFQNSERHLACEFTFTCEGRPLTVTDAASWSTAVRLARDVTEGRSYNTAVGDATHYHADYVNPRWASYLEKLDVIGRHIFYKVRPEMPGGVCPGCLLSGLGNTRTPRG